MTMIDQAQNLLDFNQKLDINLLDRVVYLMYTENGTENQKKAGEILNNLKEHPDAWTRVDTILEFSQNQETKYYALQILEKTIKTKWKVLPKHQTEAIKKYIVGLIIKNSSDEPTLIKEKIYINKLNVILIQILKFEWPKNWPTFISDIVGASTTNESVSQNNMEILKLLSEEVFDFSSGQMTQIKAKNLKESMNNEFQQVFQLCTYIMSNSQNTSLISVTLETLLRFLNWIPLGYIFETQLIPNLINTFFVISTFRNVTLKCLTEIVSINVGTYQDKFTLLFEMAIITIKQILPLSINLKDAYRSGSQEEQQFIQNLSLFITSFLREHGSLIEKSSRHKEILQDSLKYLVLISEVDDDEIFKICLEYWNILTADLYREAPHNTISPILMGMRNDISPRRLIYNPILSRIRRIMISKMAKPEEVLVVENDQGEVVREFMKDTDSINMYKNMRETLVYLTHLDSNDTEAIMTEKLQNQVNGSEWSWKNLNTLCWAIGSISGAMHEEDEKKFLVTVIKDLLGLVEQKRGKDNKAIIASNIMYIVGQYPRFLRVHWKFLKTVVNKLFEFMHETHEGVQDMACDTFIKISQKCRRHFVQIQLSETIPFIEEILTNINTIICDLEAHQVHTFYEAVGYMISAQNDASIQDQLIEKYMLLPNTVWDALIAQATNDYNTLKEPEAVKQLANILKTNVRACQAVGTPYISQLGRIYLDMLNVYKVMSSNISEAISQYGQSCAKQPLIKQMRVVKKESLNLISCWISKSTDPEVVVENFIPPLLDAILLDYQKNVPEAREAEVLSAVTTIINKLEAHISNQVPQILGAVFECTLMMINKDFEEYPEHRKNFFTLLQAVNQHCFKALLMIQPEQFKLVLDSIIWAFKHTMRDVAEIGLEILLKLLQNIRENEQASQGFYQTYYLEIMQHVFAVVTDTSHIAGLTYHSQILAHMFALLENNSILVPLSPEIQSPGQNIEFVQLHILKLMKSAYPHLQDNQVKLIIKGFFDLDQNLPAFKEHLRDFLVQIKEYTGEDQSDLYLEERNEALKKASDEKRRIQESVPGILNPHELPEEMQD